MKWPSSAIISRSMSSHHRRRWRRWPIVSHCWEVAASRSLFSHPYLTELFLLNYFNAVMFKSPVLKKKNNIDLFVLADSWSISDLIWPSSLRERYGYLLNVALRMLARSWWNRWRFALLKINGDRLVLLTSPDSGASPMSTWVKLESPQLMLGSMVTLEY